MKAKSDWMAEAESRETSIEIMEALWWLSCENYDIAVDLWQNGLTEQAFGALWERVTKNGLVKEFEFCWGAAGSRWYEQGIANLYGS